MSRRRSPRGLTGEERSLWERATATAKPLKLGSKQPPAEPPPPATERPAKPAQKPVLTEIYEPSPTPARRPDAIDHRTRSRLGRGLVAIDARVDLHGLTQDRAHRRLVRFLGEAQERGLRIVLVITGKGRPSAEPFAETERGVLRRQVPHWLAGPELAAVVAGYAEAQPVHGGGGALYVRLRRKA